MKLILKEHRAHHVALRKVLRCMGLRMLWRQQRAPTLDWLLGRDVTDVT